MLANYPQLAISKTLILKYYDPAKAVKFLVDTSSKGLGTVLLHASKSLTRTKKN